MRYLHTLAILLLAISCQASERGLLAFELPKGWSITTADGAAVGAHVQLGTPYRLHQTGRHGKRTDTVVFFNDTSELAAEPTIPAEAGRTVAVGRIQRPSLGGFEMTVQIATYQGRAALARKHASSGKVRATITDSRVEQFRISLDGQVCVWMSGVVTITQPEATQTDGQAAGAPSDD